MRKAEFESRIRVLIEEQQTTAYVVLALEELGLKFVDEIEDHQFFINRAIALQEENQ